MSQQRDLSVSECMVLTVHESNGAIEIGEEYTLRVALESGRVRHNETVMLQLPSICEF